MEQTPKHPHAKHTALIADDDAASRQILLSLLNKLGYRVIEAENGSQAVQLYQVDHPDIVIMDQKMPVMDGIEATKHIKSLAGDVFVPVLFITAASDETTLSQCIEAGGDDFISKPYSHTVLRSKVHAMERILELHSQLREVNNHLVTEQEIARKVFSQAVVANNVALDILRAKILSATHFSGDVLLTAYSPAGDLHILLGDFTGHGLSAALGAMPTAEVFRTMAAKGFVCEQIIEAVNNKLCTLLPTGMFLAAHYLCVSHDLGYVKVFNCGMPDALLIDPETRNINQRIGARSVPLGIVKEQKYNHMHERLVDVRGCSIILVSDGLIEARNRGNELFGSLRLDECIHSDSTEVSAFNRIDKALIEFCGDVTQADDISLVEVPLVPELSLVDDSDVGSFKPQTNASAEYSNSVSGGSCEFSLALRGETIANSDPVPILINQIQELQGLELHRAALFTVITELYVNAVDHGLLKLDSSLKTGPEGFAKYFELRSKRLADVCSGFVEISIKIQPHHHGGKLAVKVEDSGDGFDYIAFKKEQNKHDLHSGRGIKLVQELCEELNYTHRGNCVEAVYLWKD